MRIAFSLVAGALVVACHASTDAPGMAIDGGGAQSDAAADGAAVTCNQPLVEDASTTSIASARATLCGSSKHIAEFKKPCGGSTVLVQSDGGDCATYWLFDATSGELRATAKNCSGHLVCTSGAPGFRFPTECFGVDDTSAQDAFDPCADAGTTCSPSCASGWDCVRSTCAKGCYSDAECADAGTTHCSASSDCLPPPGCSSDAGGCPAVCYGHCTP